MTEQELARLKTLCRQTYAMKLDFPSTTEYGKTYDYLTNLYVQNLPKQEPEVIAEPVPASIPAPVAAPTSESLSILGIE